MCGIVGGIDTSGGLMGGDMFIEAIALQRERGNGLGGGFAAYGIFPELKDYYALQIACNSDTAVSEADSYIRKHLYVRLTEDIPTRSVGKIKKHPIFKRYFVVPGPDNEDIKTSEILMSEGGVKIRDRESYMKRFVFEFNKLLPEAFVMSCGINMGVFKGVGYPEDIGEFFMIDKMKAYIWLVHSRFPTNSQGWWGGAHPFSLLNWSVVHNGEITSYGVNKNYLEMYGYRCVYKTDTEVVSYLFDFLIKERGLSIEDACTVISPPLWEEIDREGNEKKKYLRQYYPWAHLNGPFAILVSDGNTLIAMNDNLKLRPLVGAVDGSKYFFSSEECSFEVLCPNRELTWLLSRGKPEIVKMKEVVHNE